MTDILGFSPQTLVIDAFLQAEDSASFPENNPEGLLKTQDREYSFSIFNQTEGASREVFRYLQQTNHKKFQKFEFKAKDLKEEFQKTQEAKEPAKEQKSEREQPTSRFFAKKAHYKQEAQKTQAKVFPKIGEHKLFAKTKKTSSPLNFFAKTKQHKAPLLKRHHFSTSQRENAKNHRRESSTLHFVKTPSASHMHQKDPLKEKEKDSQKDQRQHQERDQDEEKKEKNRTVKIASSAAKKTCANHPKHSSLKIEKPELPAPQLPKLGLFSCYFMLDKLRLSSESQSYALSKEEIQEIDDKLQKTHKERLVQLKKAMDKEKQVKRWGIFAKAMTLILSLTGVITGVALIATGAGVVAGAMLITAGLLTIASQLMELTGGWQKVAEIMPGDDLEKNRGIISWIQIGITVLSLILSAVTFIFGGFMTVGESMKLSMQVFGGITTTAQAVGSIGVGVTSYQHRYGLADVREYDIKITRLKEIRKDLMVIIEDIADRLEKLIEYFSETMQLQREIFRAEQRAWR